MTLERQRGQLSTAEQLHVRQGAERLKQRFARQLNSETIERFLYDSLDVLLGNARKTEWVPLLAERFAGDRIRAVIRLEGDQIGLNPSVLFLCVHNAGRSQMAAGFMRALSGGNVDVYSGGSEPAESVNHAAVAAMAERGIDIGKEVPQPWADEIIPGMRYVDWEVEDPAGKSIEEIRPIRDDLESRVRALMQELEVEPLR
jgi:protein-tyrosine-phosphatase